MKTRSTKGSGGPQEGSFSIKEEWFTSKAGNRLGRRLQSVPGITTVPQLVLCSLCLQHRTLHNSSANSSGQGPGPPPHPAVQETTSICTKNINWINVDVCFNMQEVIYPWYICSWFTHCTATSQAQIPALDPCPPSPLLKLGGCIRQEQNTSWEKRGHCFGFCFFHFPGSPPCKHSTLNTHKMDL